MIENIYELFHEIYTVGVPAGNVDREDRLFHQFSELLWLKLGVISAGRG